MNEPYENCPWCKGYGRQDTGLSLDRRTNPRGPCMFCDGEREKAARLRFERTGDESTYMSDLGIQIIETEHPA